MGVLHLRSTKFPRTYDLFYNDRYIGYIVPSCDFGYDAILHDGFTTINSISFSVVLKLVVLYERGKNNGHH